jgi:hypothetical protein
VSDFEKNSRLTLDDYYIGGGVISLERRGHWSFGRTIGICKIHPSHVDIDEYRLSELEDRKSYPPKHCQTAMVYPSFSDVK